MTQKQFYDWQTDGGSEDVSRLVAVVEERAFPWCMIGDFAVNHWSNEPMTTNHVDLVIASEKVEEAAELLKLVGFAEKRLPQSYHYRGSSNVSFQVIKEKMFLGYPRRAVPARVQGIIVKVASLEDTLHRKVATFSDSERRRSKRLKDLSDISRLLEAHPHLQPLIPESIASRLEQ